MRYYCNIYRWEGNYKQFVEDPCLWNYCNTKHMLHTYGVQLISKRFQIIIIDVLIIVVTPGSPSVNIRMPFRKVSLSTASLKISGSPEVSKVHYRPLRYPHSLSVSVSYWFSVRRWYHFGWAVPIVLKRGSPTVKFGPFDQRGTGGQNLISKKRPCPAEDW